MTIKNLIGKNIISIYECQKVGYILNINIKGKFKKIESLTIIDEENDIVNDLKIIDILDINNDFVTIKNLNKLSVIQNEQNKSLLNSLVINLYGECFGMITNLIFDKNYNIQKIITDKIEFKPNQIIVANYNYIIINTENKSLYKNHFAPKKLIQTQLQTEQKVSILPKSNTPTPIRINSTTSLLGRKLCRDLYNLNGEIIARKNSTITIPILNIVKQSNIMTNLIQCIK